MSRGVEPLCKVLQIAPSGYRRYAAQQRNPELLCNRAKRDAFLMPEIHRVWEQNMKVYGADKIWRQLHREQQAVARCTVERLMRRLGIVGVRRGKTVCTTALHRRTRKLRRSLESYVLIAGAANPN